MAIAIVAFMGVVWFLGPLFCLGLVMWVNRQDRRDGYTPDAPTGFYVPGALMSLVLLVGLASTVLSADTVIRDGCELLEPGSLTWWLAGCFWNN